ncbi:AGAP002684-PA-like protein [Anopheles sinensis]|uniref:AGAP002684-PA-like protein n=1 Tax=Anopheles sinensis TaxID=74873 RepID=A0A084VHQ2_ANOSI|nr:AGAP002684-PA-like protein [Anopheles sinensis]
MDHDPTGAALFFRAFLGCAGSEYRSLDRQCRRTTRRNVRSVHTLGRVFEYSAAGMTPAWMRDSTPEGMPGDRLSRF